MVHRNFLKEAGGYFTLAEQLENEETGELQFPAVFRIWREYQSIFDGKCDDHRTIIIRAIRNALNSGASIEEVRSCINSKLVDFAGCVACKAYHC